MQMYFVLVRIRLFIVLIISDLSTKYSLFIKRLQEIYFSKRTLIISQTSKIVGCYKFTREDSLTISFGVNATVLAKNSPPE